MELRSHCLSVLTPSITVENVASCALLANEHKCEEMMEVSSTNASYMNEQIIETHNLYALVKACLRTASKSPNHLSEVFSSEGFLQLNKICPELGAKFTQIATERMVANIHGSRHNNLNDWKIKSFHL